MNQLLEVKIMNKRMFFLGSVLSILTLFSACQKQELYIPKEDNKVTDLVIPEGFNWSMIQDVALQIVSPVQTSVLVYTSEDCNEKSLVAVIPVFKGSKPVDVSIPAGIKSVYVKYTNNKGEKAVLPVPLKAAATRAASNLEVKLPEDVEPSVNSRQMSFYPSSGGYGTLLFEDSWPKLGDYDFNDLVARYQIVTNGDNDGVTSMDVWVQLTALGGIYPYQFSLMLDDVSTDNISSIQKGDEIGAWTVTSQGNESVNFLFNWEKLRGQFGGKYYNTEKEYPAEFSVWRKQVAFFSIEFKNKVKVTGNTFNFFLKWDNNSEIHLMGYRPTAAYTAQYNSTVDNNTLLLDPATYYRSLEGFVWGLKVPKVINHALENVDFNKAYPQFSGWVLSAGKENQNWYESGNRAYLMPSVD